MEEVECACVGAFGVLLPAHALLGWSLQGVLSGGLRSWRDYVPAELEGSGLRQAGDRMTVEYIRQC